MSEIESVGDADDLEIILDGDDEVVQDEEQNGNEVNDENQQNAEDETKKVAKPKRIIKNPQPKLNEQTLKGPRGLAAIESYFTRVKFKGRGHEEQDLNVLLKTYEYWCHRLFPKFPFDSCVERLEKLGTKRATQTQVKKIRMGLNFDEPENAAMSEEEVNDTGGFVDTYNEQFDELASSTNGPEPEITEEQSERIRQNLERAKALRQKKLQNAGEVRTETHTQSAESTRSSEDNSQSVVKSRDNVEAEDEPVNENQDDKDDDIDNILDFINTDEEIGDVKGNGNNDNFPKTAGELNNEQNNLSAAMETENVDIESDCNEINANQLEQ